MEPSVEHMFPRSVVVVDSATGRSFSPQVEFVFEGEELPSNSTIIVELNHKGDITNVVTERAKVESCHFEPKERILQIKGQFGLPSKFAFGGNDSISNLFQEFSVRSEMLTNLIYQAKEGQLLSEQEMTTAKEVVSEVLESWKQIETKCESSLSKAKQPEDFANYKTATKSPQELYNEIKHITSEYASQTKTTQDKQEQSFSKKQEKPVSLDKNILHDVFGYMPWQNASTENPFRTVPEKKLSYQSPAQII